MFTGLIETMGEVVTTDRIGGDLRLVVRANDYQDEVIALGDSIAINGACLTVIERQAADLAFDVSLESLDHTLIGDWTAAYMLNLERAVLPTTRLGGHLVTGHVDGVATLVEIKQDARSRRLLFQLPTELKKYIAKKGSITINGTSLTVNSVTDNRFDVNIIPHTLEVTTLGLLKTSDKVHIEVDLIARYVERMLTAGSDGSSIDQEMLADFGFINQQRQ